MRVRARMTGTRKTAELWRKMPQYARETAHAVAVQAEKDTREYVPKHSGRLVNSGHVEGNVVVYSAPYARLLHYGKAMVDPKLKTVGFLVGPAGSGVWKSRAGVKKVPSEKKLWYQVGRAHWFNESERKNIGRWLVLAQKEMNKRVIFR